MRAPRSAAPLLALLAAAGAGCRHAAVAPGPLPAGWRSLAHDPAPFAALYRLAAGGQRDLVLTVRGDGARLSLTVAVPPGGAALSVWLGGGEGWLERVKERCRERLPGGEIPLGRDAVLPLDAHLAALLLSGLVPSGAREDADAPGWVEAAVGDVLWRARIEGSPAVCNRVVIAESAGRTLLEAELKSPVGSVPGALVVTAGSQRAEMTLQRWRVAEAPQPPPWLAGPQCAEAR